MTHTVKPAISIVSALELTIWGDIACGKSQPRPSRPRIISTEQPTAAVRLVRGGVRVERLKKERAREELLLRERRAR